MSVASEILRIQHNIADAYSKVAEKGGTVPLRPTSAVLAESIISIPQNGPDGNPVGTIISFMGLAAPSGYLVCDGAEYGISEYPALASLFQQQFGTSGHFGGDGEATFAVPDLRNLFLRGYHGEGEEQLSGEIGVRQAATKHSNVYVSNNNKAIYGVSVSGSDGTDAYKNADSAEEYGDLISAVSSSTASIQQHPLARYYTSRPLNMAVLYCIKAVESASGGNSAGEVYSTEEQRIGTWIDGRPVYQRTFEFTSPASNNPATVFQIPNIGALIQYYGYMEVGSGSGQGLIPIPFSNGSVEIAVWYNAYASELRMKVTSSEHYSRPCYLTLRYTKTTDEGGTA